MEQLARKSRKEQAMTSYRKTRGVDDESPEAETLNPCRYCGSVVLNSTLATFGARCRPCYDLYLKVGYSGAAPPPRHKPAAWVEKSVRENAARIAAREKAA